MEPPEYSLPIGFFDSLPARSLFIYAAVPVTTLTGCV